jgi:hypothetical protein
MPEFYDMYNDDGLEIYEGDETLAYSAVDSFVIEDEFEDLGEDVIEVIEDDLEAEIPTEDYVHDTVPGSDAEYVEFNADDTVEVREKSWEEDKDPALFIDYLKDKLTKIPRHSGNTIPGCERATAYVKDLDNQASRAMRADYDGKIDEEELDKIRKDMQKMVDRLENHIERLSKNASIQKVRFISEGYCETCDSSAPVWYDPANDRSICVACESETGDELKKTATTPVVNVYMTPFERAVVGTIINAKVSGGRNIEEVYEKLKNKYNFTPREELAFVQLISDHGYPIYRDRGLINEPTDPASGDNVEFQTNYYS